MSVAYAVVPAAGRGLRMGGSRPKQFLELCGKPILDHTLTTLARVPFLSGIQLVVPEDFVGPVRDLVQRGKAEGRLRPPDGKAFPIEVIAGGAERQESVYNGLSQLPAACEWVVIHDGVRPFASPMLFERTWSAAGETGAAIAAIPSTDTVKRVDGLRVVDTLPRQSIWLVQTPQIFHKDVLMRAYEAARDNGWMGTDDASFVERLAIPIAVAMGERTNIKVTTPDDLAWGELFLRRSQDRY
ncbi:MAG: 2-C-methyl-D-erythritol 4-phosphate cytidylyltransferase [Syntrophobacteraceae bacterium]